MKVLIVASTENEIKPFLSHLGITSTDEISIGQDTFSFLITGVGMVPVAFALGRSFTENSYDLAVNAGIAGSFDFSLALGDVCLVVEDVFAELGAEDGDEFLPIEKIGFTGSTQRAEMPSFLDIPGNLKQVKALTVNKVHGNELSIAKTISIFHPQIESMEGAAFFYACTKTGTPSIQIRSISNYVERRNSEKWNIPLAIDNLNISLKELFQL